VIRIRGRPAAPALQARGWISQSTL